MTHHLTLALLEEAPDRQTAELLLVSATQAGADADEMRRSWARWEHNSRTHLRRGDRS